MSHLVLSHQSNYLYMLYVAPNLCSSLYLNVSVNAASMKVLSDIPLTDHQQIFTFLFVCLYFTFFVTLMSNSLCQKDGSGCCQYLLVWGEQL